MSTLEFCRAILKWTAKASVGHPLFFFLVLFPSLFLFGPAAESQTPEVELQADFQEQVDEGHVRATGYVDIKMGDTRLQADEVEFWPDEMRVEAKGNVVFQQGDQKIVATHMEANLTTKTGKFYNAYGVSGQDLFYYGDVIEKESDDVYVIERGAFTSCAQPNPRWHFTSSRARIRRDHHVRLTNAFLKVKAIPVFYLPYMVYPINKEERSTGFLMPQIGTSTFRGFMIGEGFFWAINRSVDATFNYERFSLAGTGLGTEFRYVSTPTSRGEFRSYFLDDKTSGSREYQLNYSLNQELPGGFKAVARADYFSTFDFQQRYQENYNQATRRSKRASGTVSRAFGGYNLRFVFDRNDTSFGERIAVRQVLPKVTFTSRPTNIGPTPLQFSFDTEASSLSSTRNDVRFDYQRFDAVPTLAYSFNALSYLTARTSLIGRYSYYTAALDPSSSEFLDDETSDRRYYEVRVDTRGPTFARIFNTPDNFYAPRYKHVVEPQFVWSYRSRVETFDAIPKFDGNDYIPGTNQLAFSLVNRLLSKRVVNGKEQTTPTEFVTWTLSQRYFFNINASRYDRQFSTPYFSDDGEPSRYSPITSRVRFQPTERLSASWNLEYDMNFSSLRSQSVVASFRAARWGTVNGAWTRRTFVDRGISRNNYRGSSRINLGRNIQVNFETAYDAQVKEFQQIRAGIEYNVNCCGFQFEYLRYNFGSFRDETLFRFGITLANVGTFGSALGGQGRLQ